jgi:hypothetical protein
MSWKTQALKLAAEFGEHAVSRLEGLLPDASTVTEAREALGRLVGSGTPNTPPVRKAAPPAPKVAPLAVPKKPAAPAIIKNRTGTPGAVAQDVLREAKKPSKGSPSFAVWRAKNPGHGVLFDTSNLASVPNVPQFQIPRVNPKRGPSERIVDALARPEVEQGINETVQRGIEGGGKEWYNTEPVLDRMRGIMPSADVDPAYAQLMDLMAATSPRARVPDNVRTGSYYNYLMRQGMPIPEKPAAGYGSIAQSLHRQNVEGLAERGGWDIYKNPKPASFSSNLQGNQQVATIDTHNFRLPGILSGDPRFLETSVAELAKSPEIALETLLRQYPGLPEDVARSAISVKPKKVSINYKPQEWVGEGYIPMEDAVNDPALWTSKPRDNEYGYYEQWQQDQAKKMGISPRPVSGLDVARRRRHHRPRLGSRAVYRHTGGPHPLHRRPPRDGPREGARHDAQGRGSFDGEGRRGGRAGAGGEVRGLISGTGICSASVHGPV